ncbi:MAG: STAS-like domain-containing protein [Actinomycetota bacterium]
MVTPRRAAAEAGVTRQAAFYHLRRMLDAKEVDARGQGRSRSYLRSSFCDQTLATDGLQEDRVWRRLLEGQPEMTRLNDDAIAIANFAFTEMVNNAIDHSYADQVRVIASARPSSLVFSVIDHGIGIFSSVRKKMGLEDEFASIQEISKGKLTTDSARHTGQGIFFTSKAVDLFVARSHDLHWSVDNLRNDHAVGDSPFVRGTAIEFEISTTPKRKLKSVFDEYTNPDDYSFDRSRTVVKLYDYDVAFVSRSEATRLLRNLDRFNEVVIDFAGVSEVGQGFVDEVFRVWPGEHPAVRLLPVNMSPAVRAMVERGLPR